VLRITEHAWALHRHWYAPKDPHGCSHKRITLKSCTEAFLAFFLKEKYIFLFRIAGNVCGFLQHIEFYFTTAEVRKDNWQKHCDFEKRVEQASVNLRISADG
jgi:hypothetical protein